MKKIIFLLTLLTILISNVYTQAVAQSMNMPPYYLVQNNPNPFLENTVIRFGLKADCYVKLIVTNNETGGTEMLADGELTKGEHGVFFNTKKELINVTYNCRMEVYTLGKNELIYSSEMKMVHK